MENLVNIAKLLVGIAVPAASFATGLRAADRLGKHWLYQRPSLLIRSLLSITIIVPVATVLLVVSIDLPYLVRAGLVVSILAIGIGPPAALNRSALSQANLGYEVGLNIVLLTLSIVFIPLALAILGAVFGRDLWVDPLAVARLVLVKALVPLLLGVFASRFLPKRSRAMAHYLGILVNAALLFIVGVLLLLVWKDLRGLPAMGWLTSLIIGVGAVICGHLLGGPAPSTRAILAAYSVMRFPALALLIAATTDQLRPLLPVVLMYALTSAVVVVAYLGLMSLKSRRRQESPPRKREPAHA